MVRFLVLLLVLTFTQRAAAQSIGTCEGVDYPDLQAFSVQFHPEACSGPHDTAFLFDRFCDLMGGAHHAD